MLDVEYKDSQGRLFKVSVPNETIDPKFGIIIGPPLLDELELPTAIMIKLHNELYARGILTAEDARVRIDEVNNSVRAALRLTTEKVVEAYN